MKYYLLIILFLLNGCISSMAKEAARSAIDESENQIRIKWAEEWKPSLINEARDLIESSKDEIRESINSQIEIYKAETNSRLESIDVQINDFDDNNDGRITGMETLNLIREIKEKNEHSPNPLSWWEILMAVILGYAPMTGAKELIKKKLIKEDPHRLPNG